MELIRESLYDALHKILLRHGVLTHDNYFKYTWQHSRLVNFKSDSLKIAKPDNILANSDSQFIPFQLSLLLILIT